MNTQIGQQMVIGLRGMELQKEEADFIVKNNVGGVILFSRNISTPEQVRELNIKVQELHKRQIDKSPLFISVDMEGGRVLRLKTPFTPWPALRYLGNINSTKVAFNFAACMGDELRAVGFNLDFAPSIDIFSNPANTVIGDRSLSSDPEVVAKLGSALVRGYIKAGVIPCAKHFPGHGNTLIDSHVDLPIENKTLEDIEQLELIPFAKAFKARLDLLMSSHVKFPNIDPEWPAGLSEIFLKKILREKLRYRNLVISDDLDMKALTLIYDKKTIAVRSIQAGINILLYCNEHDSPPTAIEAIEQALADGRISKSTISENHQKVLALKKDLLGDSADLEPFEIARPKIGHPDHLRLAKAIVSGDVPEELLTKS